MDCVSSQSNGFNCYGNEVVAQIGDTIFGGIVFYIDSTGQSGLVAALDDVGSTQIWGCHGTYIEGAGGLEIGTGYENSINIAQGCTESNIAAKVALDYVKVLKVLQIGICHQSLNYMKCIILSDKVLRII